MRIATTWCAALLATATIGFFSNSDSLWAATPPAPTKPQATEPLEPIPAAPEESAGVVVEQAQPVVDHADHHDAPCADGDGTTFCGAPIVSPPERFWARADALLWWTNGMKLPPLVTTSPQGTNVSNAGVLPAATILYGNDTVGNDGRGGFRTTIGMWLDCCHAWGVEFDYFMLGQRTNSYDSGYSTGDPILARPFYNVETNAQASELVAYPDVVEGSVGVNAKSDFFSVGADLTYNLCSCNCCDCYDSCNDSCGNEPCNSCCIPMLYGCRTDLIVGLRHYNYSDGVSITENLRMTDTGARFDIQDNFHSKNEFYGSELGLKTTIYRGRWSLGILTKLAIGNTHETTTIGGQTVVTPTQGSSITYPAGILAVGTNSDTYQRDDFTVIPQLGLELGYQLTQHWQVHIGYDLLYWGNVQKAADQIDTYVDPRNWPPVTETGLPFPAYPNKTASFWAQGINLGAECRF